MRTIDFSNRFKPDYRREKSRRHGRNLDMLLREVIDVLIADQALPHRNFDHQLTGKWNDCRDCHARPDLVLIYRKVGEDVLELVRLGSHSELGL